MITMQWCPIHSHRPVALNFVTRCRHHDPGLTCANRVTWFSVFSPVKLLETESNRLPVKRPRVPASVLRRPALKVPSAKLGWITWRDCAVHQYQQQYQLHKRQRDAEQ